MRETGALEGSVPPLPKFAPRTPRRPIARRLASSSGSTGLRVSNKLRPKQNRSPGWNVRPSRDAARSTNGRGQFDSPLGPVPRRLRLKNSRVVFRARNLQQSDVQARHAKRCPSSPAEIEGPAAPRGESGTLPDGRSLEHFADLGGQLFGGEGFLQKMCVVLGLGVAVAGNIQHLHLRPPGHQALSHFISAHSRHYHIGNQ